MIFRIFPITFLLALGILSGCNNASSEASGRQDGAESGPEHAQESHSNEHDSSSHQEEGKHAGHGEDESSHREIHLSPNQREQLDIRIAEAGSGSAAAVITAPATVMFDSDRIARVGPRLKAKVVEVKADLGTRVAADETVALLDSVALGQAKSAYLTSAARYSNALAAYKRNQELAADQIISDAALQESRAHFRQARAEREAAKSELELYGLDETAIDAIGDDDGGQLSRYALTTPIEGVIQKRDLVPGQTIDASQTPIHVVDNNRMWVMISADEQALPRLDTNLPVTLRVRPLPDRRFSGETGWISSELDSKSRTVQVRATVANPNGLLKAGMFGRAQIETESTQNFALVPVDAVQNVEDQDVVFVPGPEEGAFRAMPVTLGDENEGQVEIRAGIDAGAAVVIRGSFDLASVMTASGRSAAHSH